MFTYMVLGHNGTIQVWRLKAVLPYSSDTGNILQCSSDQSTDLFLELSINYIKYHLDQLLLTRFIENCIFNNTNLPFMPDLMHTIRHTPLTIPTKTLSLLHLVSFILSFSHSLPLFPPLWFPPISLLSPLTAVQSTAVRRGMRGYSTAMEGNAFTGWPGDLPNPWRNPTICYRSASRSVRILIKPFLSENARVFKIVFKYRIKFMERCTIAYTTQYIF